MNPWAELRSYRGEIPRLHLLDPNPLEIEQFANWTMAIHKQIICSQLSMAMYAMLNDQMVLAPGRWNTKLYHVDHANFVLHIPVWLHKICAYLSVFVENNS